MNLTRHLAIPALLWMFTPPVAGQESDRPVPNVTLAAGAAVTTYFRGNGGLPLSITLAGKSRRTEITFVSGRVIVGSGLAFGADTGFNISPWQDGRYAGLVLSRTGSGNDAILSAGARVGTRPVAGPGRRLEARIELAHDNSGDNRSISVFMAYFSIGYDIGGRATHSP